MEATVNTTSVTNYTSMQAKFYPIEEFPSIDTDFEQYDSKLIHIFTEPEKFPIKFMPASYDIETRFITAILANLGIKSSLSGYRYLRSAIRYAIDDPESLSLITKVLYPAIAKEYGTTKSRVERSIRNAIASIDARNSYQYNIFPDRIGTVDISKGEKQHYTNKKFIAGIVEYVKCV